MDFVKGEYKFSLIDEPLQKHVVAWEKAMRQLNSRDGKEMVVEVVQELTKLTVTNGGKDALFSVLEKIARLLGNALKALEDNETATLSSNRGNFVKAAMLSGWITTPEYTPEEIDNLPPWTVQWIAGEVAGLYNRTQEVPKV